MRSRFDEQLGLLKHEMIQMGALCEELLSRTVRALTEGDKELAAGVMEQAGEVDRMERAIEDRCLRLLLQQQPVARDLRVISAALKMITDLERIGDQAEDIAAMVTHPDFCAPEDCGPLREMAECAISMVTDSVNAYVAGGVELAREVIARDDKVDAAFRQMREELAALMGKEPGKGQFALDLLMISKYFERIGDHATNLAEWVIFSVTGLHKGETV